MSIFGNMNKELLVLVTVLTACARPEPEADQTPVDSVTTSPDTVLAHPESAAIARFRALIPDSVLERRNACPFECCVYGDWVADTVIPMLTEPRSNGAPVFTLAKGDSMKTEFGVVYVTSIALVVVTDTVPLGNEGRVKLLPGDTLVLLDPIGEGYWTAWRRGEILEEVPPFFESWVREGRQGRMIGQPGREWWVRVTAGGRTGWFRPDRLGVTGADACS